MDYGKTAYLKVDDLSHRIDRMEVKLKNTFGCAEYSENVGKKINGEKFFYMYMHKTCDGEISAMVKLSVMAQEAGTLTVTFSIQNRVTVSKKFSVVPGYRDITLLGTTNVEEGDAEIELAVKGTVELIDYEILVFGVGLERGQRPIALSTAQDYACLQQNGFAQLYRMLDSGPSEIDAWSCDYAHLCKVENELAIFYVEDGKVYRRSHHGSAVFVIDDAKACVAVRFGLVILRDGAAYFVSNADGKVVKIPTGTESVKRIIPVTKSKRGGLILEMASARIFYKERVPEKRVFNIEMK